MLRRLVATTARTVTKTPTLAHTRNVRSYALPLVPGPTMVPEDIRNAVAQSTASSDMEPEFVEDYVQLQGRLQKIVNTDATPVVMTGEAMVALWAGLRSCLRLGDRVLSLANGVYGEGISHMAAATGAKVTFLDMEWTHALPVSEACDAIRHQRPDMVTAVHCDTPSGVLNDLKEIGQACRDVGALFYVDFVSSAGGTPVNLHTDDLNIDLGMLGSQKCLSMMSSACAVFVSERAWERVADIQYRGYDALEPFSSATQTGYFPYTPDWNGVNGLSKASELVLSETTDAVYARHQACKDITRSRARDIGLELYIDDDAHASSTCTAIKIPDGVEWTALNQALRARGLGVGGSFGPLAGRVFRIGHMGSQAQPELVHAAMDVVADVVSELRS